MLLYFVASYFGNHSRGSLNLILGSFYFADVVTFSSLQDRLPGSGADGKRYSFQPTEDGSCCDGVESHG